MSQFTPNSFQVPNAFVDDVLNQISDAACKIYLVVCRKTRGWNKEMDSISLSQLEAITGKSRPTVIKAKNELINIGLLVEMPSTIYGNTYKLGDETNLGWMMKFPSKNILLGENTEMISTETAYAIFTIQTLSPLCVRRLLGYAIVAPRFQQAVSATSFIFL